MSAPEIEHVSDTALWVAAYRAMETERPDALFRDPLAARLAGEKGRRIASSIHGSRYNEWSIVIRTVIIDRYIQELTAGGIDAVLNIGAGLDTRPYRLDLPKSLRWIEIDFPHLIQFKEESLQGETRRCELQRISLDLSDREARRAVFSEIASKSKKILVLTEGVVPYLTNEQVAELGQDLYAHKSFIFWMSEFISPKMVKFLQTGRMKKRMGKSPFQFAPKNWFEFFEQTGWKLREIRYLGIEAEKLGRSFPYEWWMILRGLFMTKARQDEFKRAGGYMLLEPKTFS